MSIAQHYLDLIARSRASVGKSTLESTGGSDPGGGRAAGATMPDHRELLERLRAEIAYVESETGMKVDQSAVQMLFGQAADGLARLFSEGPDAALDQDARSGLEAVVKTDGSRPVLFVKDDFVDLTAPSVGTYAPVFSRRQDEIRAVCRSVGRVNDPSGAAEPLGYQGTAWVLGDGLVATNYHVLRAVTRGARREGHAFQGQLNEGVNVDFGHENGFRHKNRRFPIKRVVQVGAPGRREFDDPLADETVLSGVNFDALDLAVLELEQVPGQLFPPPLPVARGDDPDTQGGLASAGRGVFLVGYPGNEHSATPDLFTKIFAGVKSYKRLAPGVIMAEAGGVEGDPQGWLLTHDASTLGGNSGSGLADLDAVGGKLLGLHFAGLHKRRNWAHALERITRQLDGVLPKPVWQ